VAYSSIIFYIRNAKVLAYETEALATEAEAETIDFSVETEAKSKTFSLEAEARPRRLKFQPRRDLAEALLRLETASRPRRKGRGHIPVEKDSIAQNELSP